MRLPGFGEPDNDPAPERTAGPLLLWSFGRQMSAVQVVNYHLQGCKKLPTATLWQNVEDALIDAVSNGRCRLEHLPALIRKLHRVGPRILASSAALKHVPLDEAAHDVRKRRSVNAGGVDQPSLIGTFSFGDSQEHHQLSWRQIDRHIVQETVVRALQGSVEQVHRRLTE
jgi:hypothetical protein